mgnify:CR=1 FL=1
MLLPLRVNRMDVFFTREDFFILFIFLQPEKVLSPISVIPDATVTVFIIADLYEKSSVTLTSPFPCICRFPLEYNR